MTPPLVCRCACHPQALVAPDCGGCRCPKCGEPALYAPAFGKHACQDPGCEYDHGRGVRAEDLRPRHAPADHLRDLDEEIATLRGWVEHDGIPIPADGSASIRDALALGLGVNDLEDMEWPPAYSQSWALAGPLLEEMADGFVFCITVEGVSGWSAGVGDPNCAAQEYATPREAIARAWLAWRKARP